VLTPSLLMDGPALEIAWNFVRILFGLYVGTAAILGFSLAPLSWPMRFFYGAVAILIVLPPAPFATGNFINFAGILAGIAMLVLEYLRRRTAQRAPVAP
jgi:hypothetical protein